ncbi:YopX family protein [Bacillus cereus]|uniref:YopX family protein n=1 Tax=Bacillus cereus TaxID=1396 RepID=UPI00211E6263|nr:YopX family protein [Bacillus cereus]
MIDKNGSDIYFGDAVRWTRVIYTDCSRAEIESTEVIEGTIGWLDSILTIKTEEFSRLLLPHLVEDQNEFELIGNGYENPKILRN